MHDGELRDRAAAALTASLALTAVWRCRSERLRAAKDSVVGFEWQAFDAASRTKEQTIHRREGWTSTARRAGCELRHGTDGFARSGRRR
ncbi:MAG TPA: hypothetical protein VFD71_04585 [Planctomycetota bacterium]|nr:hypothetical protein [Planctomycetota bacterium]